MIGVGEVDSGSLVRLSLIRDRIVDASRLTATTRVV